MSTLKHATYASDINELLSFLESKGWTFTNPIVEAASFPIDTSRLEMDISIDITPLYQDSLSWPRMIDNDKYAVGTVGGNEVFRIKFGSATVIKN